MPKPPSDKNQAAWTDDQLDRRQYSEYLTHYLTGKFKSSQKGSTGESFVLNINAEWGFGKTYFLLNWCKDLENKGFPVIYFDAWKNDFSEDPLLAFIAEIDEQLSPFFKRSSNARKLLRKTVGTAKKVLNLSSPILLGILTRKLLNISQHELVELISQFNQDDGDEFLEIQDAKDELVNKSVSTVVSKAAGKALEEHKSKKKSISEFKRNLDELMSYVDKELKSVTLPLFILVDELDRCRPNYAIELLESIKHLFGVRGVYFIIATDSAQLAYAVEPVYGSKFDSHRYLRRFFDQEYTLPEPNNLIFADFLLHKYPSAHSRLFSPLESTEIANGNSVKLMSFYSSFFNLSLRDQEQTTSILEAISFSNSESIIHLGFILILIVLKLKYRDLYEGFSNSVIAPNDLLKRLNQLNGINKNVRFADVYIDRNHGIPPKRVKRSRDLSELVDKYLRYSRMKLDDIFKYQPAMLSEFEIIRALQVERHFAGHKPFAFSSYIKMVDQASYFS